MWTITPASERRPDTVRVDLPVSGRKVSVIGNGPRAAVTAADLVSRGASVVVHTEAHMPVAPSICDMAARGHLLLAADGPTGMCLKGVWLVFACTDGEATDLAAAVHADRAGVWCIPTPGREAHGPATRSTPQEPGSVTIIGGGPGDPGLLTVRGRAALLKAEVVVFDRLAPISVLAELDPSVLLIDASKVPNGRATPQSEINRLLIEHARAGRRVVRLKGGDPFVFGRGLEEVQACHEAGLVAEVVPGLSSAISVPGLAGVSLTHRGLARGFTVVSGHVAGVEEPRTDWAALARSGTTLVLLMAVSTLPEITDALLRAGMDPTTPTATIQEGGSAHQKVLYSTLSRLAEDVVAVRPPAITVIGKVVAESPQGTAI